MLPSGGTLIPRCLAKSLCHHKKPLWLSWFLSLLILVLLVLCCLLSSSTPLQEYYHQFNNQRTQFNVPPLYRFHPKHTVKPTNTSKTTGGPAVPTTVSESYPRNYHFIMDNQEVCQAETPFLVLMVPVAPNNLAARDAIRQTWGKESVVQGQVVLTLFMLGLSGGADVQEKLQQENLQHGDLLQSNFADTYLHLTTKTMVIMDWLATRCPTAAYAMKVDSDMFLNVDNLVVMLRKPGIPKVDYLTGMLMWNRPVVRSKDSKWYVPLEMYPDPTYPTYTLGMGYVFSNDLPEKFVQVSKSIRPFNIEDAYIGMCMKKLGLLPTSPPDPSQFRAYNQIYNRCEYSKIITFILGSSQELVNYWTDLKKAGPPFVVLLFCCHVTLTRPIESLVFRHVYCFPRMRCAAATGSNGSGKKHTLMETRRKYICTCILGGLMLLFYLCFGWNSGSSPIQAPDPGPYHVAYPRNYRFIMDDTPTCRTSTPFLLLMVQVATADIAARDSIRKTWGSEKQVGGQLVESLFVLGLPGGADAEQQQEKLRQENLQHHDLIQSNFQDSYHNLTIKTMMMLEWLAAHCAHASYVVKIDSDMLLHVPNVVKLLLNPSTAQQNYMTGLVWWHSPVLRNPFNKFYMPKEVIAEAEYPPYPLGMAYVMSLDLPAKILGVSPHIQPIFIEDAYLGMCLKRLGIPPTDPPVNTMFIVDPEHPLSSCSLSKVIAVTTTSISQMMSYWERSRQPDARC
ncbi:uncharacterized protein AB9W97_015299 [Spinachia spinachia]